MSYASLERPDAEAEQLPGGMTIQALQRDCSCAIKCVALLPPVSTNQIAPFRFRFALERSQPRVH